VTARREQLIAEFLSAVSHDLRTPLAVIVGYAELIGERADEATRREGAARIMEAAERLSDGIENVVALFETGAALGAGAVHPLRPDTAERERVREILCADGDEAVRDMLGMTFPEPAFTIVPAGRENEQDALTLARSRQPDVVLLDWELRSDSGDEVLAELKRLDANLPVIVLAAEGDSRTRRDAEAAGADGLLVKPFSPLQLLASIELLLAEERADRPAD
jgi:CheY-like chemotaxis protein